jgi:hypothetical protein
MRILFLQATLLCDAWMMPVERLLQFNHSYAGGKKSMAGFGHAWPSKERADFDNTVLDLPGVHLVYVNFTRQSAIYIVIMQAAALGGLLDDPVTAQLTKKAIEWAYAQLVTSQDARSA